MQRTLLILAILSLVARAEAAVHSKTVAYEHNGTQLEGYLAWDDSFEGKRPGVLVVHEWWGLNDYARGRADQLATLGYVAFCPDMYGKGRVTEHPQEAGQWAGMIRANVAAWRERAAKGLAILQNHELVDRERLAAIGYCFGGSTALQLAFSGADLKAVVTFHGGLFVPSADDVKRNKARLLICHGAIDGFISEETAQGFRAALEKGNTDYAMVYFGGAKHSFTVKGADEKGLDGIAYNAAADRRSWQYMRLFLTEAFGE